MYLSRLTLNPRHASVLRALADIYAMHRLLWRAFPDRSATAVSSKAADEPHPLLYRVEPISRDGMAHVLARSVIEPKWNVLHDLPNLLCSAEYRDYAPDFQAGQWLRYRLRANPIVSKRKEGEKRGERQGLFNEADQAAWLVRQGEKWGFALPAWEDMEGNTHPDIRIVSPGIIKGFKAHGMTEEPRSKLPAISLLCVDYEGLLQITDKEKFQQAIRCGIGPAKGLGFGLLSVARALL